MASWLALDWDQDQFHVLAVQASRRGVQITHAATWAHPEPFVASNADRVGKALRDFLKARNIPVAPVLVGLGRDRVILKELRFPAIAPHEEAALVRFQTAKELTEPVDHYAIDYAYLNPESGGAGRHVMAAAVRREFISSLQSMCQSAGLKLHAVTPRLFGAGAALAHSILPDPSPLKPDCRNVILTPGQRWAELCFFRGERIVQAQAIANGPLLVGEVKRNLAVFQAQHAVEVDATGPDALHFFGEDPGIVQALQAGINLPVVELDPLENSPAAASDVASHGSFAGGLGIALLWSSQAQPPVNLASPKKHQAPTSVGRQRGMFYGGLAAAVVLIAIGMMYYTLDSATRQIRARGLQKEQLERDLRALAQDRADLEAYKDWEQTTVPWLDEIYDLTARYPFESGFRVNQLHVSYAARRKDGKDPKEMYVGRISLTGNMPAGKEEYVEKLHANILPDTHVLAAINRIRDFNGAKEFQLQIDVSKQASDKFQERLVAPPPTPPKVVVKTKDVPAKKAPAEDPKEETKEKEKGGEQ